ncbi:thiol-activated cytolysin family protein [Pontibacter sp. G13]|uniref:thiol-activated cytolysin family protein n=1 Tax=Pontibacter sp. G13 TaxID=3074898 RepID=UPI0028896F65|nr:thiol-activated cytolysin family protein [Pontibacter sp. G13]WNJ19030.1 thiol-activated cytolysin family protein [Pontibacter sp. G13]
MSNQSRHIMVFKPHFRPLLLLLSLGIVIISSCNSSDDPIPETFSEVVRQAGRISNPQTYETVDSVSSEPTQELVDGDFWICKEFEVDISQNADEFALYASNNAEIIYPGNFLQGQSVSEGSPKIIPLRRGPGTITINTLNGSSIVTETVDEISFSSIAQATNNLIGGNNGSLSANISYVREEIRSLDELGVKMNANYSSLGTKVKGSFDYNSSSQYNSIFVKVTQSMYSIVLDIPDIENAFAPDVTPEDLAQYAYPGNPATYVSSVNYGRIFYLLIQSTQSSQEIKAAIDASFKGGVASGGGGIEVESVNELSNLRISGYAYGGDAGLAAGALLGGMEDVKTFVTEGGSINNGSPISYVVRSLEDPSTVVAANLATQYTVTECENISGELPVFTDTRQSVGAAAYLPPYSNKMFLFDGASNEYVVVGPNSDASSVIQLWQLGQDHQHPFRNSGVGAALYYRSNGRAYFFSKTGSQFCTYEFDGYSYGPVRDLWTWGTDYSCPFVGIGAGMDASVGSRNIACMFNQAGTEYTLYESGQFSTPRSIDDFQIRDRDQPVEIPFESVGAALRLHLNDSDRVVMAIFDGPGKQYVYYDADKNVVVGPLEI